MTAFAQILKRPVMADSTNSTATIDRPVLVAGAGGGRAKRITYKVL